MLFLLIQMLLELFSEYGSSNYLMNVLTLLSNVIEKCHLNEASDRYISLLYRQIHKSTNEFTCNRCIYTY